MDSGILDTILHTMLAATSLGLPLLSADAHHLLAALAVVEIVVTGVAWAMSTDEALQGFLWKALHLGVVVSAVLHWPALTTGLRDIVIGLGLRAGGNTLTLAQFASPSTIYDYGVAATAPLFAWSQGFWGTAYTLVRWDLDLMTLVTAWVVRIAYWCIAFNVLFGFVNFHIGTLFGLLGVALGVYRHTAFLAQQATGWILGASIRLMVNAFMASIIASAVSLLAFPTEPTFNDMMLLALGSLTLAILAWSIPAFAASLFSGGGPSLGGHAVLGGGIAAGLLGTAAVRTVVRGSGAVLRGTSTLLRRARG